MTEQTYLYYWRHDVWAVLGAWAVVVLVFILLLLIGEELWWAGYESALRSVSVLNDAPVAPPVVSKEVKPPKPEKRPFLAPPVQAFPGIRALFSGQRGERTQSTE